MYKKTNTCNNEQENNRQLINLKGKGNLKTFRINKVKIMDYNATIIFYIKEENDADNK
jgi:hypothetical protein